MNPDLTERFNQMVEILKKDLRCKGGWHYGSYGRGLSDNYSDYDPVFLISDQYFNEFAQDVRQIVANVADELLIFWPENYNDDYFKNFCSVIRIKDSLHQLDFFLLNHDHLEAWMCRQHLRGCTRPNIIFDRDGEVGALLDQGLRPEDAPPDLLRAVETYWFHIEMLVKYFKRKDLWKIIKNLDFVFHAHVDVLLAQYNTLDWGGWETRVKQCVPAEKQHNLAFYFREPDFLALEKALKQAMLAFYEDSVEVCRQKGIANPHAVAQQIMAYFTEEVSG